MLRFLPIAIVTSFALVACGCGTAPQEAAQHEPTPISQGLEAGASVRVPEVVALAEGEAVKVLAASGLVANVRYAEGARQTGKVLHSDPEAGTDLPANSVVVLSIALAPQLPPPGQEHEGEIIPLSHLVEDNPEAFVGLYRDEADVPHVVFGSAADPAAWEDRLTAAAQGIRYPEAAEGLPYQMDTCSRDRKGLRAIQDEIATRWWTDSDSRRAFGVWVHPATCTVRVESDLLTAADIQALVDRYGTGVSFDTTEGSAPTLLSVGEDSCENLAAGITA